MRKDLTSISFRKHELARDLAVDLTLIALDKTEIPQILATIKIDEIAKIVIMVEHIIKVVAEAVDRIIDV